MTPTLFEALVCRDDGTIDDPSTSEAWAGWVSAGRTRNFLGGDPLLDWLNLYGEANGFVRDDQRPGYDPRTDFLGFIFEQGARFEQEVMALIAGRYPVTTIATGVEDSRSLDAARATVTAMEAGAPVIAQAVLRNPENRTFGLADLLVRSDVLNELVPGTVDDAEARVRAPALGPRAAGHYRVVDIKFHTLEIDGERRAKPYGELKNMAQVWVYNEALGRIQGYRPPSAHLLGRSWKAGWSRGTGCFERLARVDHDAVGDTRSGRRLGEMTTEALDWIRRLRADGAGWRVLPEPSVAELYPHARNQRDAPWHAAKAAIADEIGELTKLPGMGPERRRAAHARGIRRWDQPGLTVAQVDPNPKYLDQCAAVLAVNQPGKATVLPHSIHGPDPAWRTSAPLELYVDFETVLNLADDFSRLPEMGGQTLIFQVGCGWWEEGAWRFAQWTVDRLTEADERSMLERWIAHMDGLRLARGLGWDQVRLVHWWAHETSTLDSAYNSARVRHGGPDWPQLPFFDFLSQVVRPAPVTVRGAFGFGLKALAKAMHGHGLIPTTWGDGPADGMGAMVGAWWCEAEAARTGVTLPDLPLMAEIAQYNEVDCRVMAELVGWLREHR